MSREAQLSTALNEAWAELERKQTYMQNAFDSANLLQIELDALKAANEAAAVARDIANNNAPALAGDPALETALHNAWAELERKQKFLESSFDEIKARDTELELLRQQIAQTNDQAAQSSGLLHPNMEAALKQAWNDLETRDGEIADLKSKVSALDERIEWLLLENKTLSNAIGIDKMRQ
jgi:FtsZ-binding cell division protein ZapB